MDAPAGPSDPSASVAPVQSDHSTGYDPTAYSAPHASGPHPHDSNAHNPSSVGSDRGYAARPAHDVGDGVTLKQESHLMGVPNNSVSYPADVRQASNQHTHQQQVHESYQPHRAQHQQSTGTGLTGEVPSTHAGYATPQHQAQLDGASYKVFCGGLSFQTDEDKLRDYFSQIGTVVDVVIMRDRMSGHPRGFGFVSFAEEAVANDVASRRHDIDGRQVEAKIAIPRNQVPPPSSGGGARGLGMGGGATMYGGERGLSGNSASGSRPNTSHLSKIFVGGLPSQVGEAEFSNYFAQFGEVVDAQVMIDHQTGNSRGFGFISFANQAAVEVVVGPGRSSTRHEIMGKTVEVKRAEPKGATPSGGDRRGRDSYGTGGSGMQATRGHYAGAPGGLQAGGVGNASGAIPGVKGGSTGGGGVVGAGGNSGADGAGASSGGGSGTYNGYNYPASVMEQYGQYYNNPQWQQYYAAMGYNMQQYPQGFNPYTYYAAYMNNAGGASGSDSDPRATPVVPNAGSNEGSGQHHAGSIPGSDASFRGAGAGHNGGAGGSHNPSLGPGAGVANSRRSRRDDRFHPYR